MTEPLVSAEVCNAFPIACVIAFVGFCALYVGWKFIIDALHWQRFCRAVGSHSSAHTVVWAFELERASRDRVNS